MLVHRSSKGGDINKNKGYILLLVMMIILMFTLMGMGLMNLMLSYQKQAKKSTQVDVFKIPLNSIIDYTINGVRNHWCFTADWLQNPTCTLTDSGNVERLLMSDEQLRAIGIAYQETPAVYGNTLSEVRLKTIHQTFAMKNIPVAHPLYITTQILGSFSDSINVDIQITRIDTAVSKGNAVLLEITARFTLGTLAESLTGKAFIESKSLILVAPREINSNALLIANNLYLDRSIPANFASISAGDAYIPPQSVAGSLPGIRFESPVYVNGNVYVPDYTGSTTVTPVTFVDKIILGSGKVQKVMQGTPTAAGPSTPGSLGDRFYSQLTNFGGFLGGVDQDVSDDLGLKILAGIAIPNLSLSDAELCRRREAAKLDWSLTRDSQLFVKPTLINEAITGSQFKFTLNIGKIDRIYEVGPDSSNGNPLYSAVFNPNPNYPPPGFLMTHNGGDPAVMRMVVNLTGWNHDQALADIGDHSAELYLDMTRNSNVKIWMDKPIAGVQTGSSYIEIITNPSFVAGLPQDNMVDVIINFVGEQNFYLGEFETQTPSSVLSTYNPKVSPSIDIRFPVYDAAYRYDDKLNVIKSYRTSGIQPNFYLDDPVGDPIACPPTDPLYDIDLGLFPAPACPGGTCQCYSKYHWHPVLEKFKSNGVSFKRDGVSNLFSLQSKDKDLGLSPIGKYYACSTLDSSNNCKVYDPSQAPAATDFNWATFDQTCYLPPSGGDTFPSFRPATWDINFTNQSCNSWGFTEIVKVPALNANPSMKCFPAGNTVPTIPPKGYNPGTLVLNNLNAKLDIVLGIKPKFITAGIFNTCVIKNTANFVAGFFVCENLDIQSRVAADGPLRIIGTFVVGKMKIDPSVATVGLRWSNIYDPMAIREMAKADILASEDHSPPAKRESCDTFSDPEWHPYPSIEHEDQHKRCSPTVLRAKADPFKWTQVDPDCGLVGSNVMCKMRSTRFQITEVTRTLKW